MVNTSPPLREIVSVLQLTNIYEPREPITLVYIYYNSTPLDITPSNYTQFSINGTGYFSSVYFNGLEGIFSVTNVTTAMLSVRLFYPI